MATIWADASPFWEEVIADGTIGLVGKLYVEFHKDTVRSKAAGHDALLAALRANGVEPLHWD